MCFAFCISLRRQTGTFWGHASRLGGTLHVCLSPYVFDVLLLVWRVLYLGLPPKIGASEGGSMQPSSGLHHDRPKVVLININKRIYMVLCKWCMMRWPKQHKAGKYIHEITSANKLYKRGHGIGKKRLCNSSIILFFLELFGLLTTCVTWCNSSIINVAYPSKTWSLILYTPSSQNKCLSITPSARVY